MVTFKRLDRSKVSQMTALSKLRNVHPLYIEKLQKCLFYDIIINHKKVGMIVFNLDLKNTIYIHYIYITTPNRGYGTQVINHLKKFKRPIQIFTDPTDSNANKFWVNRGFKKTGYVMPILAQDPEFLWTP